ncbi:MAG TPA: hypothetical protein VMH61_03170, partial [Candidatus Acidoferrales bacterium]|nr:hypothetical protein [Candidatus Acidoferrales bacterium]
RRCEQGESERAAARHEGSNLARSGGAMPHPYAMRRSILLAVAGAALLGTGLLVLRRLDRAPAAPQTPQEQEGPLALAHPEPEAPAPREQPAPSPVAGLDLVHVGSEDGAPTAPADGGTDVHEVEARHG